MILLLISVHISDVHAPEQEVDALRHYLVYTTLARLTRLTCYNKTVEVEEMKPELAGASESCPARDA